MGTWHISDLMGSTERSQELSSCHCCSAHMKERCQTALSGSGSTTKRRKCFFIHQIIKPWESLTRMLWVFILRDKWIQKAIR